jgi:hypothetical protein
MHVDKLWRWYVQPNNPFMSSMADDLYKSVLRATAMSPILMIWMTSISAHSMRET